MKKNEKFLFTKIVILGLVVCIALLNYNDVKAKTTVATCEYKYSYDYNAWPTPTILSGAFTLSILNDGKVEINDQNSSYYFKYSGSISDLKCPLYLVFSPIFSTSNVGSGIPIIEGFYVTRSNPGATYNATYAGTSENVEKYDVNLNYLAYNSSKATKITILKINGSYKVTLHQGDGFDSQKEINIEGLSQYQNSFENGQTANYPTWINSIEDESGKTIGYRFSDSEDEQSKENYICQPKILGVYGQSNNDPNETCETLFGSDFLKFLNNNVFTVVRIAIPLLLIAFTTFDFAKVVFIDDKEGIQNASKRFGKRLVAAILVFLIPQILIWLSEIIGADKVKECSEWMQNNPSEINNMDINN